MSPETLVSAIQIPLARAQQWADPLSAAMALYGIDTPIREAAFVAQCAHESMRLVALREIWGPTKEQELYEPFTPKSRALGNTTKGDGFKFRGGGLIGITGRYNFRLMGQKLGIDLETFPERITDPSIAAEASAQFWTDRHFNNYADAGDFLTLSRALNIGNPNSTAMPNGWADRYALWDSCRQALGIDINAAGGAASTT